MNSMAVGLQKPVDQGSLLVDVHGKLSLRLFEVRLPISGAVVDRNFKSICSGFQGRKMPETVGFNGPLGASLR
jgi:hypothetical protein